MTTSRTAYLGAFAATILLALASMLAFAPTAQADEPVCDITIKNIAWGGDMGLNAKPGEKYTLKAAAYYYDEDYEAAYVKGVTYQWKTASKLKAKANGAKLTINKVPKVGKYSIKVTARNKDGKVLAKKTYKLAVKKKPSVKVQVQTKVYESNDDVIYDDGEWLMNVNTVKKGASVIFSMKGATWSWDNNTKKPFYTWTVKNLKTGKTATWNSGTHTFKKNSIIGGGDVGGGSNPEFIGNFKQKGKFKITATVFHSNKKITTSTKTVTVK